jgi:hypothetical protein
MELHPMNHLLLEGEPADHIDAWSEDGGALRHGTKRSGDDSAHQLLRLVRQQAVRVLKYFRHMSPCIRIPELLSLRC